MRPGSSFGGFGAPGSRMGTGQRLGTAQRQANFDGVGLNTKISVTDRPVTRGGMTGIRIGTAGPGRQVQDTSYYLGLLRSKNKELTSEIASFNEEIERFQKDTSDYSRYERKYEGLVKEVRELEGQLADYNLAMDKSRTGADSDEIVRYHQQLKKRNEKTAKDVDGVFIRKKQREEMTRDLEQQMADIRAAQQRKITTLPEEEQQRYHEMMRQSKGMEERLKRQQDEVDMMSEHIRKAEQEIKTNSWRNEYMAATRKLKRAQKEREELQAEIDAATLDPEEARARLLSKAKDMTAQLKKVTAEYDRLTDNNEQAQQTVQELTTDIEERKGETGDSHKYEVLFQRDKEMTEFMEKFEETKVAELDGHDKTRKMIVALLEQSSKDLGRKDNMPSQKHVNKMKKEASFKRRQVDAASSTHNRLQAELKKRQAELDKINGLNKKIEVELKSLKEKIETMESDMVEFAKVGELRDKADATRELLLRLKKKYKRRNAAMRQQVGALGTKYEKVKNELSENETARTLENLEQKLRVYEQNIFKLQDYIEQKTKETDYRPVKEGCLYVLKDINEYIKKKAKENVPSMAAAMAANLGGF